MPTYDYHCENCKHDLEVFQKITAPALKQCPSCDKETLIRVPGGGIGLSFKGSGFYLTDYGPKKSGEPKVEAPAKPESCPCGKESKCSS
jgi:putative FmdB family regulatory protein